ncbi:MAG: hypothetical protein NXI30_08500 [bacterium]|nr:hypothetical protein [bacterium]
MIALLGSSLVTLHCADGDSGRSQPPEGGLAAILRHPDPLERIRWTAEYLEDADPEDLFEIQYVFETAPLARGDREYALFGHWWATFDPKAAYDATFNSLRMEGGHVIRQIMRTWARNDPKALNGSELLWDPQTWGSTAPGMRPELVEAVTIGWYESGEPDLEAWLSGLSDASAQSAGLKTYVTMKVMYDGGEEALRWALALDEDEGRKAIFGLALNVVSHEDPQLAIEWLGRAEEMGADVGSAMRRIANAWGHHDPVAAAAWLLEQEDSRDRAVALKSVAQHWVRWDYDGFREWLRGQQKDVGFDKMRATFVRSGSKSRQYKVDWRALLEVAEAITEPAQNRKEVYWVLQRWYLVDEEAVLAWFEANPDRFPEKVKKRLGLVPDNESALIKAAVADQTTESPS